MAFSQEILTLAECKERHFGQNKASRKFSPNLTKLKTFVE
jgi:hypothetical protein